VAALVRPPRGKAGRPSRSFTLEQAKALLAVTEGTRWHGYVALSLLAGIRTEEARALRWDHVVTLAGDAAGWQPVTTARFDHARAGEDCFAIYVWRSQRTEVPGTEISLAGIAGALRQGLTGLLTPSPLSRRSDCMIWNVVV
jgi:integrase